MNGNQLGALALILVIATHLIAIPDDIFIARPEEDDLLNPTWPGFDTAVELHGHEDSEDEQPLSESEWRSGGFSEEE